MFNRTVQLDVVKKTKKAETAEDEEVEFSNRAIVIGATMSNSIRHVTQLVVVYMVADTIRKIAVNRLSK